MSSATFARSVAEEGGDPPGGRDSTGSPSPAAAQPLLRLQDISVAYGPYRALFDVSMAIPAGSAVALVGANGAGKSTVARAISALIPVASGSIVFDGTDITGMKAWEVARLGLTHVTEGRSVFSSLTVEENLVLPFRRVLERKGVVGALEQTYEAFPKLGERRYQSAGTLSGGEQRILALARVFAVAQKLLVVDELSLGLAPVIVDEVYEALARVLATGTSLLIIEQHVDRALDLADSVVVLSKGSVVYDGSVEDVGTELDDLVLGRGPR